MSELYSRAPTGEVEKSKKKWVIKMDFFLIWAADTLVVVVHIRPLKHFKTLYGYSFILL